MRWMKYKHSIVSPHLDDAVFSLGGFLAMAKDRGEKVLVINVFNQSPTTETRQKEDQLALQSLGCDSINLEFQEPWLRNKNT